MNRARVAGAVAAILTALLVQATLVAPLAELVPVSLPLVLVTAIALVDGPGAGIAFGFSAGMVADLQSHHPVGILALCWMLTGLVCGRFAHPDPGTSAPLRRDLLAATLAALLATTAATALLVMTHSDGATAPDLVLRLGPTALGDLLVAVVIVPISRTFLRSHALRLVRS